MTNSQANTFSPNTQSQTLTAWQKFMDNEPLGEHSLPSYVLRGWELSKKYTIDPYKIKIPHVLSKNELEKIKVENKSLLQAADPMIKMLAATIKDTGYMATFMVPSGYLLAVVGDDKPMLQAEAKYNIPGANRSIESIGASALTLAVFEKNPVIIRGAEHYNQYWHDWMCAAAPIFDNSNNVVASLAISCPLLFQNTHTLTLVQTCAEGISLRLREIALLENEKRLNTMLESVHDALPELVVTVNADGSIAYANNNAISYFGLTQDMTNKNLAMLFGKPDFVRIQQLFEQGKPTTYELEVISKCGPENLVCRFVPIATEGFEILGMTISISKRNEILNLTKHVSGNYAKYCFDDLKGESPILKTQIELAKRAASSHHRILLTGESGTGKELFAQSIHTASQVRSGPFVAISCAAIPRDLIESELFGYVGGAFTGARRNGMIGKMELATDGTLFLDEINSLPLEMQAKLLRVLQQMEIVRIGDTKPTAINARIIAASNKNLQDEVRLGGFREDLYFRLNVIEIIIPPLRERQDDIGLLAHLFLRRQSLETNHVFRHITSEALDALYAYQWPGNVRELDNICERALLWSEDGIINLRHLPIHLAKEAHSDTRKIENLHFGNIQAHTHELITQALVQHNGNISKTAVYLGIARCTLHRRIKKFNIKI